MSKKLIKKCLSILLAIVMMFACFAVTGFAWSEWVTDENGDYYEVFYEEAADLTVSFDEATSTLHVYGNGAVPKADKWVNTKAGVDIDIAGPAMYPEYHDKITKLVIHEGITAIGTGAFSGLINLKEVQLPETLECVGDWAFMACLSLEEVNFPENLKYITPEAAFCLTRLRSIVLPENFEYCDCATFAYCFFVEEVVIPESINTEEFVLIYSPHIKTITNKSDDVICRFGFEYCYPQDDNELAEKLADLYMMRSEFLVDAAIKGTSFDEVGYLEKASELMGMTFYSEEDIWNYANSFYAEDDSYLYNDYHVYCYENSAQHLFCEENGIPYSFINDNESEEDTILTGQCGDNVYYSLDKETGVLTISGEGDMWDYSNAEEYTVPWDDNITRVIVTEGITNIGPYAFDGCYKLEEAVISSTVTEIGDQAFGECVSLERIYLPEGLKRIGESAFFSCFNLKDVSIPSTLEAIDALAFGRCYSITEITIPESVTEIGVFSFGECLGLEKLSIPEAVEFIDSEAFNNCINLDEITLYNKDVVLEAKAFGYVLWKIDEEIMTRKEVAQKMALAKKYGYLDSEEERTKLYEEIGKAIIFEAEDYGGEIVSENATIHGYPGSTAETYANENGIKFEEIKDTVIEDVTVMDENTGVTAEYTSDIFDGTPEMVITEGGKNANIAFNGKFGKYTSYDISFEIDGEKVQPNGKVTIKIPLPEDYNPNSVKVFFIDDNGNKTKLESTYENGCIIFETDHFSEYAIVDESSEIIDEPTTEPDEPTTDPDDDTTDNPADNCSCNCHKSGFMGFIWKILRFFYKLFKTNPVCVCGIAHY